MAPMIRKQLYITEAQERALKRRARELGVSEAELARRALEGLLHEEASGEPPRAATESSRQSVVGELIGSLRRLGKGRRFSESHRAAYRERGRAALYDDRMSR